MDKYKRLIIKWQETIFQVNPLKRDIDFNYEYLALNKIISFIWPRRAGKTYYMFYIIKNLIKNNQIDLKDVVFIDFTSFLYEDFDIEKLLEDFFELFPDRKPFFVFDEIQELKNFKKIVMYVFNSWYKIFLSWSNSSLLSSEISTIFRWRTIDLNIFPLSFEEFLSFKNIDISLTHSEKQLWLLKNQINEFLEFWSYPEIVLSKNSSTKFELIKWYFSLLLYKDLLERYSVENEYVIKYLIKKLLFSTTKEFNINKIFNDLKSQNIKIWKQTIYNYLEYLKEIFFIKEIYDEFRKWAKKFFFYDVWYNNIMLLENLWQRFENAVYCALNRCFPKISYIKSNYNEIDFVVPDKDLFIQVCYELNLSNIDRENKYFLENKSKNKFIVYFSKDKDIKLPWIKVLNFLEFLREIKKLNS